MHAFIFLFTVTISLFCTTYGFGNSIINNLKNTGLPVIYINTNESEILKNDYIDCNITILNATGTYSDTLPAYIKGRGNSTWECPKKPYNIKLKNKASILGLSSAKKFILLANWYDRTLCRTAVGMKLGQLVNAEWPLHCKYTEVVLNGKHVGNYLITEGVEIGKNRINIDKESGVVVEYRYDEQLDETHKFFQTDYNNWLFEFKDPNGDDLTDSQYQMAKDKMNAFELRHLNLKRTDKNIEEFIDLESFVKWFYVKNILQMEECNRYYVIENGDPETKIKMGPLWDFDWTLGIDMHYNRYTYCWPRNKLYFKYLANNTFFLQNVAQYHFSNRNRIEREIMTYYDEIIDSIQASQKIEESIWHQCETNNVNWEEEIKTDREFLHNTFLWLDDYLKPYYTEQCSINCYDDYSKGQELKRYDLCGRQVKDQSDNCIFIRDRKLYKAHH